MRTTTSIRHPETINTISLLDSQTIYRSLELSREEVDIMETIGLLRILAQVVNSVTSNLTIWTIEIFIRMHPRTITATFLKNMHMILTYILQFKPLLILEQKMVINRQRPQVEFKMTNKPNFPPQMPCWIPFYMKVKIENPRHHPQLKMLAWSRWVVHAWVRRVITFTITSRTWSVQAWPSRLQELRRATTELLMDQFSRKRMKIDRNKPWASTS